MEYFTLRETENGYALAGTVTGRLENKPAKIEYLIHCDTRFQTRQAGVYQLWGEEARTLQITVDGNHRWLASNTPVPDVAGLIDIGLPISPATFTLALRRLNLAVGHSRETVSAWLSFPSLTLRPLPQKYTRLSTSEYAYEAPSIQAAGRISVDENMLAVSCLDLWRRV